MTSPRPVPKDRGILLVDDEAELREILAEGLEMSGYLVLQAGSAEDALQLALGRPGLLLAVSDVRLPGMSGVELAARLAEPDLGLRTILISGYFVPQPINSRLLSKPFTLRQLETAIQRELQA